MIRLLEICMSFVGLVILAPIFIVIIVVGYFDTGRPIFSQSRLGKRQQLFTLYKFRTMSLGTESKGTHEVSESQITGIGRFLRRTKLDELPQLWNVLKGEMSLVGPRPNLPNQLELIRERAFRGVYEIRPGITGLAQIQEIDMSTPHLLAETDAKMIEELNFKNYINILFLTLSGEGQGDRVSSS